MICPDNTIWNNPIFNNTNNIWERIYIQNINYKIYAYKHRGIGLLPINKKALELYNINIRGPIIILNELNINILKNNEKNILDILNTPISIPFKKCNI